MSALLICLLALRSQEPMAATSVLGSDVHLTTPVAGLDRTNSTAKVVAVKSNHGFGKALRVVIGKVSSETNATQLTLPIAGSVEAGDTMLASVWVRGGRPNGRPGRAELMFERSSDPWTKSVTRGINVTNAWRQTIVPFKAAESYAPGAAMLSLRLAFGSQTVEIGPVDVANVGKGRSLESMVDFAASRDPLGRVPVAFDFKRPRQTMLGLGGNFCQPRYGSTEAMDVVGKYALANLRVSHARIGLPLEKWNPKPGIYKDDAQAAASLQALAEMTRCKIPTVVSIWEGPLWMLGGTRETTRTLDPSKYEACIDAIVEYLAVARDKYRANVAYVSFNEPDLGINFNFTSKAMGDFIRLAGPKLRARSLNTKFLVGDTAGGSASAAYSTPLLQDATIAPYLGPIAFHNWDSLSASDESYQAIAAVGAKFRKPVWCLEAGHDAQLWQAKDPWSTWENALRTAMAYERTLRLTRASLMDYWTYQDNYALVDKNGPRPYPVFHVMRQMTNVFAPGSKVVTASPTGTELQAIATTSPAGRFGVLLVNPQGTGTATLKGLPPLKRVTIESSNRNRQRAVKTARTDAKGGLSVVIPLRSVVTVTSP